MVHDWESMWVDTNAEVVGKHVIMKFTVKDGESHEFRLNKANVDWLREALKRGIKLAEMNDR